MGNLKVYHDNEPIATYNFTGYTNGTRLYYNATHNVIYIDGSKLLNKALKITYSPVTADNSLRLFGAKELPSSSWVAVSRISHTTSSYDSTTNTGVITVTNTNSLYKYLIIGTYEGNTYPDTFSQNCGVTYVDVGWDDNTFLENYTVPDMVTPSFLERGFYKYQYSGTTQYSMTNGTGLYYIPPSDTQGRKFLVANGSDNTGFVFYTADFNSTTLSFYNFEQKTGSAGPTYEGKATQIVGSTTDKALIITRLDHTSGSNPQYQYYYSDVAPSVVFVPGDKYPPAWGIDFTIHKFNGTSWD